MVRIYVILGSLLLALVVAAFVGPAFVDWTQYRQRFEAEATRVLGRDVRVRGDASARLLPFPSIAFEDVTVGQTGDPIAVTVERFTMDLELAPFLRGEFLIFDMRIDAPRVTARLDEGGRLDWGDEGERPPADAVTIERMVVADGEFSLVDEASGRTVRLSDADLVVSAESLIGPWRAEGEANVAGARLEIDGTLGRYDPLLRPGVRVLATIDAEGFPAPVGIAGDLNFDEGRPSLEGDLTSEGGTLPPFVATGRFDLDPEALTLDEYRLAMGTRDDPYVIVGDASMTLGAEPRFAVNARGQRLDANRFGEVPPSGVSIATRIRALERFADALPRPEIDGTVSLRLPAVVVGGTALRDLALDAEVGDGTWRVSELALELPGRTRLNLNGQIDETDGFGFRGEVRAVSTQPTGLATWLGNPVTPGLRSLGRVGIGGSLELTAERQSLEGLRLQMDESLFTGALSHEPNRDVPLEVSLEGPRLDLDAAHGLLVAILGSSQPEVATAATLQLDGASLDDIEVTTLRAELISQGGALEVTDLEVADIAGARLEGSGTLGLDGTVPSELTTRLSALETAELLELLRRRVPADWSNALADRGEAIGALDIAMNVVWLEPNAPVGFDLNGTVGPDEVTASGTLAPPAANGDDPSAPGEEARPRVSTARELSAATVEVSSPSLAATLRQFDVPISPDARTAIPADLTFEIERGTSSERLDAAMVANEDRIEATVLRDEAGSIIDLRFDVAGLGRYGRLFDIRSEALDALRAEGTVRANGSGALWRVEADELSVGDTLVAATLAGSDGRWQGELEVGTIALHRLLPLVLGGDDLTDLQAATDGFPAPAYPEIDLLLSIDARTVEFWPGLVGREGSMQVELSGTRVGVEGLEAQVGNGTLRAEGSLSNADGTALAAARFEGEGLAADDVPVLGRTGIREGQLRFSGALDVSGADTASLVRSASGGGTVVLDDPVLDGIDPLALRRIYERVDSMDEDIAAASVRPVVEEELAGGRFAPRRLALDWTVSGGTVRLTGGPATEAGTRLSLDASVDLLERTLDATTTVTLAVPDDRGAGGDPTVRLAVEGPLDDPQGELAVEPLTGFLNLRAFELERDRVAALRAALVETQRLRRETLLYNRRAREADERIDVESRSEALEGEQAEDLDADPITEPESRPVEAAPRPVSAPRPASSSLPRLDFGVPIE